MTIPFWSLEILRVRPSEIEFQCDFSNFVLNTYMPFQLLENFENKTSKIEFGSHFSSIITVFVIQGTPGNFWWLNLWDWMWEQFQQFISV